MSAIKLMPRRVEKVWGRRALGPVFGDVPPDAQPVGEIWFEAPPGAAADLLVKYLFTSERLSIQVHPDDAAAQRAGHPRGKDEAWVVLAAEPAATIGLGLTKAVSREELRTAAIDGGIEHLVDWRTVQSGDAIYSPAGTIHALGPGLVVVEVQQNTDLTYRLYDYGRPRELHLDEGVAVARPEPFGKVPEPRPLAPGRTLLCAGAKLQIERWRDATAPVAGPAWIVPLAGSPRLGGKRLSPGSVWLVQGTEQLEAARGSEVLVALPSSDRRH